MALRDPLPWGTFAGIVAEAERAGYRAVFLPEIDGREAFSALAGLAGVTSSILLGTGVVPIVSRDLATTAMAAATVHELSGGRLLLGLGTGPSGPGSLARLRTTVERVRAALAGERVEQEDGARVRLSLDLRGNPPEVWVAALGPRAMRMAGEIADGVILNWCPPERVGEALARIREGAQAAGRDPGSVAVAAYVRASLGLDEASAMPALQAMAGLYASFPAYRRQFEEVGLGAEASAAVEAHRTGRPDRVPERLVRSVCLVGEPEAARARLEAFREAGAHLPLVYPVAPSGDREGAIRRTIAALAPGS